MCPSHKHVLLDKENLCFPVELGDRGCLCTTGSDSKRNISCDLEFIYVLLFRWYTRCPLVADLTSATSR